MRDPDEPTVERTPGLPRLLAFYQDAWDSDGTLVGWRTVAWGLRLADGPAVTVPADGRPAATLWHSVADAAGALDAYVDSPSPRRHQPAAPSVGQARAATTSSPGSSDGSAARPARPDVPPAREARDGPPGGGTPPAPLRTPPQGLA